MTSSNGFLGQDCHAVEALLAVNGDVVAKALDLQGGKRLVLAFQFLKTDHIRFGFLEPGEKMFKPLLDRIDVPGGDAHGLVSDGRLVRACAASRAKRPAMLPPNAGERPAPPWP